MPKNEDGEVEIVLGSRQLLTVFFIVVVLFGIFFAMGYILGRPAGPSSEVASARKGDKPLVVESPGHEVVPPAGKFEGTPLPVDKPAPKAEPEKAAEPAPEPPKHEAAKVEKTKPEPVKQAKAEKQKPEPAKPAPQASGDPAPGAYLQLTATSQHEANLYVDVLHKKGFKALAIEVPENHNLYRVVVGPVAEGNVNKTKTDLKAAGFPGDKAIKRTY